MIIWEVVGGYRGFCSFLSGVSFIFLFRSCFTYVVVGFFVGCVEYWVVLYYVIYYIVFGYFFGAELGRC